MDVSLQNLPDFARDFVTSLPRTVGPHACVVGLRGELGAGKTTFVQCVAHELGGTGSVTSPTFVFAQRYKIMHPPFTSLIHIDAYRLKSGEAHTIGWSDFFSDPENLILIEWPELLEDEFPKDASVLTFTVLDENRRSIAYA